MPFLEALACRAPHPSLGEHAATYGRMIGSWTGELRNHRVTPATSTSIEVHFAWVLDGRAVQDVWIVPARGDREPRPSGLGWYGTTLCVFDPERSSWRVFWCDPLSQRRSEPEGRRVGEDVVQVGIREGRPIRWTFSEIGERSLLWQGHILQDDGDNDNWQLEIAISLRRSDPLLAPREVVRSA